MDGRGEGEGIGNDAQKDCKVVVGSCMERGLSYENVEPCNEATVRVCKVEAQNKMIVGLFFLPLAHVVVDFAQGHT